MTLIDILAPETRPLLGREAIVTGGGRGIGRAITLELARLGAHVTIGYYNNSHAATLTMREANARYGDCAMIRNLPMLSQNALVTEIECDILVNNAGIAEGKSVRNMNLNSWDETIEVNLTGVMRTTQAVLPGMIEKGWGRVVNIASVVGLDGRLGPSSYAASKAGLIGFTKAAAHELARKGVTVNAVAPGFIDKTGLMDRIEGDLRAKILDQIPMHRLGTSEDIAQAVAYLIQAPYVTGTVLNVSGGYIT